jgi:methylamine dehydrogenase accessory protein MauD
VDVISISYVVLWIVVLAQGAALVLVFRSVGSVFLASREGISRDGLKLGKRAPGFVGFDGERSRSLDEFVGKWLVLVFAAPTCQICLKMLPELGRLRDDLADQVEVLVLLRGDEAVVEEYRESTKTALPLLAVGLHGVAERYSVRVSPFAHVLDPAGVIRAKGLINTIENVAHQLYEAGLRDERIGVHVHEPGVHSHDAPHIHGGEPSAAA